MQILTGLLQRLIRQAARLGDGTEHLHFVDALRIDQTIAVIEANVAREADFQRHRIEIGDLPSSHRHLPHLFGNALRQCRPTRPVEQHRHALQHIQIKQHTDLEPCLRLNQRLPQQAARQPIAFGIRHRFADHIEQAPTRWQRDRPGIGDITRHRDGRLTHTRDQHQARR
ncbi:hypothetical protein D3C81_1709560 [compost metagenome]